MAENTRNEEKPNDEDLRTKKPTTSSNQARAIVTGNIEDVVACINKAREAQEIAAHDLEKANNWLNKSQELLSEALAAISAGDTPKETPSGDPDAIVDVNGVNVDANPEQARPPNNDKEAETHNILDAEQLKIEVKLCPTKPKKDEKPSASHSYAGITVEGNPEDVVACIDNAKKAFAENDLEKAKKWLIKSQRMLYTANALELLDKVQAAIAAKDAPKEIPSVNPDAGLEDDDTNSVVDHNPEQARTRTPTEPPSGPAVHNENIEGAKTCIVKASKALKAGDFDKAENLMLKAKRMDASQDVEQYLKSVHDARARNTTSRENAVPEEGPHVREPPEQTNNNMDEANTYLQVAENAFKAKNYEQALMFLDNSEALYTSERAVKLRKQVQDAMSKPKKSLVENYISYFIGEKPSNLSHKERLEKLIIAIRNDIDAGNLDEAERKLQTPGFVKAIQLKKLRIEVEEKMALRTREEKPKTEESKPKPMEQMEPPRNEMLSDIRAEEANTCINVAEKAYYDGDLDKAERLLRKAERLYPTERAKNVLGRLYATKEEKKPLETKESIVNKVKKLINSGLEDMERQNYYSAELAFRRAKHLQPSNNYLDELLTDVQTKIKNRIAEGTSTGTQNRHNEKPTYEYDKYIDWAQDAYNSGDIDNAHAFLKLAGLYNSTERSRALLVMVLKAKHGVKNNESDDDDENTFVVVNSSPKSTIRGKVYLRSAEDAFIKGVFKVAKDLISKSGVIRNPYVAELTEIINKALIRNRGNRHWFDMFHAQFF